MIIKNDFVLGNHDHAKELLDRDMKYRSNYVHNYLLAVLFVLEKEPQKANKYLRKYAKAKVKVRKDKLALLTALIDCLSSGKSLPPAPKELNDPLLLYLYGVVLPDQSPSHSPKDLSRNIKRWHLPQKWIPLISMGLFVFTIFSLLAPFVVFTITYISDAQFLLTTIEMAYQTLQKMLMAALFLPIPLIAFFFGVRYYKNKGLKALFSGVVSMILIAFSLFSPIFLPDYTHDTDLIVSVNNAGMLNLPETEYIVTNAFEDNQNFPASESNFKRMTVSIVRYENTVFNQLETAAATSPDWTSSLDDALVSSIPDIIKPFLLSADHYLLYSVTNGTYNEVTDSHNEGFILLEINIEYQALFIGIYDGK